VPYVGRLTDDTFTIDEVNEMLDSLLSVVRGEVDNELNHTAHTNILLLVQLFQQAEKWHLKLQADISELENRFVHGFFFWWLHVLDHRMKRIFALTGELPVMP